MNRTGPLECTGKLSWVTLHKAETRREKTEQGGWPNRGIVNRSWNARLGGKDAAPWIVEHGVKARGQNTSTLDLVPPSGSTRLEPGDFVEAVIEDLIMSQAADD